MFTTYVAAHTYGQTFEIIEYTETPRFSKLSFLKIQLFAKPSILLRITGNNLASGMGVAGN